MSLKPLILNLKREYWEQIRDGMKGHEFRLINSYWSKRIIGKEFSHVELRLGYPKNTDTKKILKKEWRGYYEMNLCHELFGARPVDVFAIDVSKDLRGDSHG